MEVTVVGAGIIGLTTARVLRDQGHVVRVVAAEHGDATTSAVAAAVWFPYRVGPADRVAAWARTTRLWLESLVADRDAGVDVLDGYDISEEPAWWATDLEISREPAPVTGAPRAWRYRPPRVEPARFMAWLARDLSIETRRVHDLVAEPGDVVVNCTGLGARALGDTELSPLFGQVVITEPGDVDLQVTITDDRDPDDLFYVIPRRDELVLGGCSLPRESTEIDPAITTRILEHAHALGLRPGAIKRVRAGLRPIRPTVRLERIGRVIHNVGHGGAGFTLCKGCADEVASLSNRASTGRR